MTPPRFDLHTHTVYSHGTGTFEENVIAAIQKGLSKIAVTEHAPAHVFFGVRGERLRALRREADVLAARYCRDIDVLMGLECDLTGFGICDAPKDAASMCDVMLLAYHKGVFPRDSLVWSATFEAFKLGHANPKRLAEGLLIAAEKNGITMLSHPSLYAKCDIDTLSRGAAQLDIRLEINSSRVTMTCDEIKLAAKNGARFVINSDAHSPERVGDLEKGIRAAEEAGVLDRVLGFEPSDGDSGDNI